MSFSGNHTAVEATRSIYILLAIVASSNVFLCPLTQLLAHIPTACGHDYWDGDSLQLTMSLSESSHWEFPHL